MALRGNFQIVVLRAGGTAQVPEIEPDHRTAAAARLDLARFQLEHRLFVVAGTQLVESLVHFGIGIGRDRRQVQAQLFQRSLAVIGTVVHAHHFQTLVQQRNRRQNAVAVQAVGVQLVRTEVGGGDKADLVVEQRLQHAVQQHGVRHVVDVELVETDQLEALGHAFAKHINRVFRALQIGQFTVHLAHEFVEVQARLALDRHGIKKAVHQEALAAANPAVHVDPFRDRQAVDEFLQRTGTLALVV